MKILHIVESLHRGAVENWLVNCFLEITKMKPAWEWTFYCIVEAEGRLEGIVAQNGGNIVKSPCTVSNKKQFVKCLKDFIKKNDFDVIHAHHDYLNAFYLLSFSSSRAFKISHIHNTDKHLPIKNRFLEKCLIPVLRVLNNVGYNRLIGISNDTISEFKIGLKKNLSLDILYYGISLNKFNIKYQKKELQNELNLPDNAKLLLFLGRFTELKNPSFLVDILHELNTRCGEEYYALFIGEGDQRQRIIEKADILNLATKIRLIGWVDNPERFFQLCDFFVFPRKLFPTEGFGMVMLEAQASGINIVVSKGVSVETIINQGLVRLLDSVEFPHIWASEIIHMGKQGDRESSVNLIKKSKFNIENSALNLIKIYEECM